MFLDKRRLAIWNFGEIAKFWRFRQKFKSPNGACHRPRLCPPRRRRSGTTFRVSQFIREALALPFEFW